MPGLSPDGADLPAPEKSRPPKPREPHAAIVQFTVYGVGTFLVRGTAIRGPLFTNEELRAAWDQLNDLSV